MEGDTDSFVTCLSSSGSSLIYSTYLGGESGDIGNGIAVSDESAFVMGNTTSVDFPTVDSYQGSLEGWDYDSFVTRFTTGGSRLIYSTYLGVAGDDVGTGIAVFGA